MTRRRRSPRSLPRWSTRLPRRAAKRTPRRPWWRRPRKSSRRRLRHLRPRRNRQCSALGLPCARRSAHRWPADRQERCRRRRPVPRHPRLRALLAPLRSLPAHHGLQSPHRRRRRETYRSIARVNCRPARGSRCRRLSIVPRLLPGHLGQSHRRRSPRLRVRLCGPALRPRSRSRGLSSRRPRSRYPARRGRISSVSQRLDRLCRRALNCLRASSRRGPRRGRPLRPRPVLACRPGLHRRCPASRSIAAPFVRDSRRCAALARR